LTIRSSTERPITVEKGSNILIKDFDHFKDRVDTWVCNVIECTKCSFWDGQAAKRILDYF
jgi:UDP-N-acetylglucosamine 2-epimerase (non-hydrolysing)